MEIHLLNAQTHSRRAMEAFTFENINQTRYILPLIYLVMLRTDRLKYVSDHSWWFSLVWHEFAHYWRICWRGRQKSIGLSVFRNFIGVCHRVRTGEKSGEVTVGDDSSIASHRDVSIGLWPINAIFTQTFYPQKVVSTRAESHNEVWRSFILFERSCCSICSRTLWVDKSNLDRQLRC